MTSPFSPDAATGLRWEEVARKKAQGKQNTLPEKVTKSAGQILKDNICTLFNLFNVLIALALALVGAWSNMLFILVIALNTVIGIVQEFHAKKLVEDLSLLAMPTAQVVREGTLTELPLQELVEGDVVQLETGRQVCADGVILTGAVEVNESLLTGESDPIPKTVGDRLLSGSFLTSGRCRARVEHVGLENYAAKLAHEAKKLRRVHSELMTSMRKVTRFTGYFIPPLGILLFLEAVFLRGDTVTQGVVSTAAGLLGMLPKGLVLLISISLAAGIVVLSKRRVLVQELFALETLAHVDTLCLDKTGTLTQGTMAVEAVRPTEAGAKVDLDTLLGSFLAASEDNNATFQALRARFETQAALPAVGKIPFSSERKWSAVVFPDFTLVVGAPERLAGERERAWLARDLQEGKRVLWVGRTALPVAPDQPLPPLEGLAALVLADPIRPNARKTLAYFQREGVDLKLISGDNPVTVSALAAQAGFPQAGRYIDMSTVTEEADLAQAAREYAVFGRVSPQQKRQLVQALQQQGHAVAMTGDGVNDLLALRQADCSVAMAAGSDAARQVAQVVLLDSDFSALPAVLAQGRRVVNNITRVAGVFFVKTIYSVLLSLVCLVLNLPFPFAPIQITLIDAAIEGYPAFFMTFQPDGRKVTGRFLPKVIRRALPNALAILGCFLLWLGVSQAMALPAAQAGILFYLVVGTVGIQAVFKASWPPNKLRVFLFATMTVGFYMAVVLFHTILQVALPTPQTCLLFLAFALVSFLLERGAAGLIRRWDSRRHQGTRAAHAPRPHRG